MFHVKHGNFCDVRTIAYDIKKAKSFYIDVSRETLTILEQMFFLFHVNICLAFLKALHRSFYGIV